jgi:hypothetical protein
VARNSYAVDVSLKACIYGRAVYPSSNQQQHRYCDVPAPRPSRQYALANGVNGHSDRQVQLRRLRHTHLRRHGYDAARI